MSLAPYRELLGIRDARRGLFLGLLIRIPLWASEVVLTLHVVSHLHKSYAAAGLASAVFTVGMAVSNPWRGRRLDRLGLRKALVPSLVVLTVCWGIAPFVGYLALLPLIAVAGLFNVPTFSIIRQILLHATPDERRKTALALDSVLTEISFMIGPALGVLAASYVSTTWALLGFAMATVAGSGLLWLVNPPISPEEPAGRTRHRLATWLRPAVVAILAAGAVAVLVLTATDIATVAALRHMGHQSMIGWALALWGLGSAIGGLVYGAVHRPVPVFVLLACLCATTLPVALASNWIELSLLLLVAGVFCAPTITATVDELTGLVPAQVRGEAMGWHGSALTTGAALGAPLAGVAIDHLGWRGGYVLPALFGVVVAVVGAAALARRRRPVPQLADSGT